MKPIRIGKIAFTNILPIYHYLDDRGLNVEWVRQVPTLLNRNMALGKIDMGPISAFAYAEHAEDYVLMPDLSISAMGPVGSIFLFTKGCQLHELDGKTIALTNTSASSVALLQIILEKFAGVKPTYVTMPPSLEEMMSVADAALLIGDDAVMGKWNHPGYRLYDLGEEWMKQTGRSMTFAVWAVRRKIAESRKSELEELYHRFMRAKAEGRKNMRPAIEEAMRQLGGDPAFWQKYYDGLSYDFGEREKRGLETYFRYATDLGLLPANVEIRMLDLPASLGMR
ncbi:menaquinone biosynthetic enzyme MqnA/MqnD family protein [Laceyella putida]|uniref:Chorismate dehydratase n=1 Tax=Laceyella putida TaxID=110101 RepID=A0ABW2RM77_9BACL